jgi:hypothetical protein
VANAQHTGCGAIDDNNNDGEKSKVIPVTGSGGL